MSDTKRGQSPAHAAYGLAVTLALALGFTAGWLGAWASAPPPDDASRLRGVEENVKTLLHRQTHLLRRIVSEHDTDWDRGR